MPDIIEATVKYPANKWLEGDYGEYADAVFESNDVPDDQIKVYGNKGDDMGDALFELERGDTYQLLYKGEGKAKLQDSDVARLTGSNGQAPSQQQAPPQQPPPQGQPQQPPAQQKPELQMLANEHARLIANTYAFLDSKFASRADKINQMPTPSELQKMAVSAAIEAVKRS